MYKMKESSEGMKRKKKEIWMVCIFFFLMQVGGCVCLRGVFGVGGRGGERERG